MKKSPARSTWPSSALSQAVVVLALVAIGALAVIWWQWEGEEGSGWHEIRNVSIQLLGLVVIGAVVTIATDRFQQAAADRQSREAEASEARQRLDDRVSEYLAELLKAYSGVKRVRREINEAFQGKGAPMARDAIAPQLNDLSAYQLEFEELAERGKLFERRIPGAQSIVAEARKNEEAPSGAPPRRESWDPRVLVVEPDKRSLTGHLERVEKNLRDVLRDGASVKRGMTPVGMFVRSWHFRMCITRHVRAVQRCLENHLLRQ